MKTIQTQIDELSILSKDDLINIMPEEEFNSRTKKPDILNKLSTYLEKDPLLYRRILKQHSKLFAIHPSKVEESLKITKLERKRWTDEEKLKVSHYDRFTKWGSSHEFPLYDKLCIDSITDELIETWRKQHKEQAVISRKKGMEKAKETKKHNDQIRQQFDNVEYKKMVLEWQMESAERCATYELAHWLHWINRWAKEFQQKAFNANKKQDEYNQKKISSMK